MIVEAKGTNRLKNLLAQLVHEIQHQSGEAAGSTNGNQQEVLLNVTMNGIRYTLTGTEVSATTTDVKLSPREIEVVRLVSEGLSNKEIALVLDISPWTVSTHLRRVYHKLNVNTRAEMVAFAMSHNLILVN